MNFLKYHLAGPFENLTTGEIKLKVSYYLNQSYDIAIILHP